MRNIRRLAVTVITTGLAVLAGLITVLGLGADWRAYTVQGGSMEPQYHPGDLIVTSKTNVKRVEPGQIIVFTADWASEKYEHRVVHRVAAVGTVNGRPIAFTRGDANTVADPEPVDLTGNARVVQFSVPGGGLWLNLLAGPITIAALAALGVAMAGAALTTGAPLFGASMRSFRRTAQHPAAPPAPSPVPESRFLY